MFAAIRLPMIPRPRSPIRSAGEAICSARGAICSTGGAICLLMPESSSTGGFDAQTGALLELARELGWELLAIEQVPASLAWLFSRRSWGAMTSALRYQRQLHLAQRFDLAYHAIAAAPPAFAA